MLTSSSSLAVGFKHLSNIVNLCNVNSQSPCSTVVSLPNFGISVGVKTFPKKIEIGQGGSSKYRRELILLYSSWIDFLPFMGKLKNYNSNHCNNSSSYLRFCPYLGLYPMPSRSKV